MKLYLRIKIDGYWKGFVTTSPTAMPADFIPVKTIETDIKPIDFGLMPNGSLRGPVGSMRIDLSALGVENCLIFSPKSYQGRQSGEKTWQLIHKSFLPKLESGVFLDDFAESFFDTGFGAYVFEAA